MRWWRDNRGILELPMQYMIAAVVATIVILLLAFASYHMWQSHQLKLTLHEVDKIVEESERMCGVADEDTIIHIQLHFPSGMKKVVFGSANAPNHYYILMDWGENRSFFSQNAKFMGEDRYQAVLYPGVDLVTLKLKFEGGEKYVEIIPSY